MLHVMPTAEPITVTWGRRLRTQRETIGLSQTALAEAVGVSQATVARYEAGLRQVPAHLCEPIAAAVGTTPETLFSWA